MENQIIKIGSSGPEVVLLQQKFGNLALDGLFGPLTQKAVENYQSAHGLAADGIVGPLTWASLLQAPVSVVTSPSDKITLWCAAIKQMEGAKPELNNPGNLRFVGQQFAINNGGFCQFDTYDHGEQALRTLLVNACSGKSSIYNPNGTLYDFYAKYAPSSDNNNPNHYAEFVAKYIGVLPTVIIKTLL